MQKSHLRFFSSPSSGIRPCQQGNRCMWGRRKKADAGEFLALRRGSISISSPALIPLVAHAGYSFAKKRRNNPLRNCAGNPDARGRGGAKSSAAHCHTRKWHSFNFQVLSPRALNSITFTGVVDKPNRYRTIPRDGSSLDSYSKDSYSSHFLADSIDSRV